MNSHQTILLKRLNRLYLETPIMGLLYRNMKTIIINLRILHPAYGIPIPSAIFTNISDDLKVRIYLYGANKSVLRVAGATTAGADLSYTFVSKEDEFYLQVLGWDGIAYDHSSSGSYTLTPVVNGNDDNEPDDTFEQAREITSIPGQA